MRAPCWRCVSVCVDIDDSSPCRGLTEIRIQNGSLTGKHEAVLTAATTTTNHTCHCLLLEAVYGIFQLRFFVTLFCRERAGSAGWSQQYLFLHYLSVSCHFACLLTVDCLPMLVLLPITHRLYLRLMISLCLKVHSCATS